MRIKIGKWPVKVAEVVATKPNQTKSKIFPLITFAKRCASVVFLDVCLTQQPNMIFNNWALFLHVRFASEPFASTAQGENIRKVASCVWIDNN
jgi:hypothetical protein